MLRFQYQTIEFGSTDIHVRTLRDNFQYEDIMDVALNLGIGSASWTIDGLVGGGREILARIMHTHDIKVMRILEVGCGIGLASLVLNKRLADITATDYHPEVENYLLVNTQLNQTKAIPFTRTGWADNESDLGLFDIIIGSDLLYESGHAESLSEFINQHAKPKCKIILIDPGRKHHARFSKNMVANGYSHSQSKVENIDDLSQDLGNYNRFQILQYERDLEH
jgi:2-polyprenyl-3-methyl-5-hydroxy-6-metoxy-1,4-benzoquinol methylase